VAPDLEQDKDKANRTTLPKIRLTGAKIAATMQHCNTGADLPGGTG